MRSSKKYRGLCLCTKQLNLLQSWPTLPRVENPYDGSQLTGSDNISETMKHIIKISTATTIFSGSTFLVVVLPISWDVDVR